MLSAAIAIAGTKCAKNKVHSKSAQHQGACCTWGPGPAVDICQANEPPSPRTYTYERAARSGRLRLMEANVPSPELLTWEYRGRGTNRFEQAGTQAAGRPTRLRAHTGERGEAGGRSRAQVWVDQMLRLGDYE